MYRQMQNQDARINYRRCPSGIPSRSAFCRNEPTVRFVSFAILVTGVFALEWARSSRISALVYSRRTIFLAVFFGIISPLASWFAAL